MTRSRFALLAASLAVLPASLHGGDFGMRNFPGSHLDILLDGKTAVRYMYAHDTSDPDRHHATYKPYLHVFDAAGKAPITKGAGGKFTHHRGIFIGWNKIGFGGKRYDRWHMKGGDIIHQEFLEQDVSSDRAEISALNHWMAEGEEPLLDERRTMRIGEGGEGIRLVIDFESTLGASYGPVSLKGDPEHAGIHYRPANEVVAKETVYTFPEEGADPRKVTDLRWVAETYTLAGQRHTVVHMNHPANPKGTKHSAYRDYGRFGAFFEKDLAKDERFTVRYRFLIIDGEFPGREMVEKEWKLFAEGAK